MVKVTALIPARKGSKRIPGKNMVLLNGKPLLEYAIESAEESGLFDSIIISSNWKECIKLAAIKGVKNSHIGFVIRPDEISQDNSHDYSWVSHAMQASDADCFMILRPTNPFRTANTILRAWKLFEMVQPCDSLRAVEKTSQHPYKSWHIIEGRLQPLITRERGFLPWFDMPTQILPELYCQNGCIQIAHTSVLSEYGNVTGEDIVPFIVEGREGHDINTPEDLEYAEWLLRKGEL